MRKEKARIVLYQLVQARLILQKIAQGEVDDPKVAALSYFYRFVGGVNRAEVDEFFTTEEGKKISNQFSC